MVCLALSSVRGLHDMYILSVPLPDDDIVDEMSVLRARMHPRRPGYVTGGEAEDRVCHQ